MAQWLNLLFLVSELSLVLSSVIVIKLDDDDEQVKQIASIIEGKIHQQEEELMRLETEMDSLNSTFQSTYMKHERVMTELKDVTKSQGDKITSVNSTLKGAYNNQQTEIKNLTEQSKKLQETVQLLNSTRSGNEEHFQNFSVIMLKYHRTIL